MALSCKVKNFKKNGKRLRYDQEKALELIDRKNIIHLSLYAIMALFIIFELFLKILLDLSAKKQNSGAYSKRNPQILRSKQLNILNCL